MSMLLRYDPSEKVLRSVGDQPNGILCLDAPDGVACFTIDSAWEPGAVSSRSPRGVDIIGAAPSGDRDPEGLRSSSTMVTPAELADAVESHRRNRGRNSRPRVLDAGQRDLDEGLHLQVDMIRSHVDLADEVIEAMEHAGHIQRMRVDPREDGPHA